MKIKFVIKPLRWEGVRGSVWKVEMWESGDKIGRVLDMR